MAYVYFDSCYVPCGFLIVSEYPWIDRLERKAKVKQKGKPYSNNTADAIAIQTDWDWAGVATAMGWQSCQCGATDGTVDCKACERTVSVMLSEAYDWIHEREGQSFDTLEEYFYRDVYSM